MKKRASMPSCLNEYLSCVNVPPYSSDAATKLSPSCMIVMSACICALWPEATASALGRPAALSQSPCALHGAPSSFAILYSSMCVVGFMSRV